MNEWPWAGGRRPPHPRPMAVYLLRTGAVRTGAGGGGLHRFATAWPAATQVTVEATTGRHVATEGSLAQAWTETGTATTQADDMTVVAMTHEDDPGPVAGFGAASDALAAFAIAPATTARRITNFDFIALFDSMGWNTHPGGHAARRSRRPTKPPPHCNARLHGEKPHCAASVLLGCSEVTRPVRLRALAVRGSD